MEFQSLIFVMLVVGFVLLAIELFVPSGGVIGILSAASFLSSLYFAHRTWADSAPLLWRIYLTTFIAMIPITVCGLYYLITKTSFGNHILLVAPSSDEVTPYQSEQLRMKALMGERGSAMSPLRPGGIVQIDGTRFHALAESFVIDAGAAIEVVAIRNAQVVVREISHEVVSAESVVQSESPQDDDPELLPNGDSVADDRQVGSEPISLDPFQES